MALRAALRSKCGLPGLLSQLSSHSSHARVCVSPVLVAQQRNNSTTPKVKVEFDQSTGVAVMHMQSPPVNSLSLDFLTEFCINVEKLEMDKTCRGLIITSSQPKVFSARLDIMEMYGKSPERCGEFWRAVQEMWLKLYSSDMVTIAAINGSSPAGGCLMSLTCDYRIMADNPRYSIGLNETQLGIVAPFWFKDTMVNTVGHRTTELALELGLLYSPSEALKVGLVDLLVPEDEVLTTATKTMTKWLAIPDHARQITKSMMRKPTIDKLTSKREADIQNFVSFITKDSIQKSLRMYLEMLKKRRG
ncbi:enoyl-CoA delta isomerase 1, mitochondrial isoform X5 [Lates calcarifer]|uniref:Enoyl-CoA delta isomerase 1, mitochondrial n=2 Tax=Lates calcarifer TaxID=8187 RepID=A0AAJ8BBY8_LATCA|nr:enoyl-CoA delta isomerase 1, mitochondrial isoform X2 [Lates calcarifer]XP_050929724.1 enoyl-CoA delta isomerase 1, mitochondrial isoform X4 [Lates calcarifer]XP_050929725.1 enoyl-CoA delta isomerase 1, mitochondrial isoform X5 [Lates calcarifer]